MKDEHFLEAILASPQDPSPRLVYADWLEEQGDSRGEFLRAVHELSQAPLGSARYRRLRSRCGLLTRGDDTEWLKLVLRPPFAEIRRRLQELDRLDSKRAVFAADSHQYRLNPPLDAARLEQIEALIRCRLPEQYRRFVTEFADGGAGPDYGIRPLAPLLEDANPDRLAPLRRPFPVPANVEEMRALGYQPPGTLPVCEIGCGGFYHLILSGPERGHVWVQNPEGEWGPLLFDESRLVADGDGIDAVWEAALRSPPAWRLEFLDWYARWLDAALWQVSSATTAVADLFDLDPETTAVSVSDRELSALPDGLRQLTALRSLNLHGTGLEELPAWIGELEHLEFLGVGGNSLRSLPRSVGKLVRLKRLFCSNTDKLERLPGSIGQLAALEKLHLSFNKLKQVPRTIGNLHGLRELDLSRNQLTALPTTIGGLSRLRTLKLTWNKLSRLPGALADLHRLEELELRANEFRSLPNCVGRLPALHSLHLGENPGLDVADACRKLAGVPTLRRLSLFRNQLTELPAEIGLLTQLRTLDLSWNQLTGLPDELAALTNLEHLALDHNPDPAELINQRQHLLPHLG
jgi:uncharacterized protein (TIGR02996 family)